ncbi:MAG: CoB--CoM heterodisulfide reductase iron-sulfur subunit A family protein [Desulfobacterales bacterium]|jgi:quinone-modifying oxidoreductase, subunit QmoA|nr:CoB--CoM heterodisulfide reductase iron-sulfur subunit A family protein [Desulfobacteraceae bacterium]MBT4364222.1 CoB--CoM heterodisulfide reductase iron-sulfur subunit A family protein [Desulfobacteraceae bacterium]MBT7086140.1 CoB--CoM heterodisulfide reductase iron-sulfur subunit A family protein [Desulfobacterales bacterium]MBT7698423.1 CoB--CoM heterodisulfide reductase iron-sulfur subunit A family protein [Desulfobacterales bacterium]
MTKDNTSPANGSILVVGGGISGLTTTLEAAEAGYEVFLVENKPYLGGRVSQLNQYFPKLCPPTCGLEINFKRIKDNRKIKVFTMAEVEKVEGSPGNYNATIKLNPRLINENCTACGECVDVCPVERKNDFNFDMDNTKAVYKASEMAFPMRYTIDSSVCKGSECGKCADVCKYNAVELNMESKTLNIQVGAVVWSTGWKPYDAEQIDNLGFGKHKNIITNMMMERLSAPNGPTKGEIIRPSDKKAPESVVFVQCAGSRDENHLTYCSYICCMASLKQATYVRAQYPEAKIYIFYIDLRTPGQKYEKFYKNLKEDENVFFIKGKVAEVTEEPDGSITVVAEDTIAGEKVRQTADMVILATGMQPAAKPHADLKVNEDGFIINDFEKGGMFAAGCANKPADVVSSNQNATGMALKAIQTLVKR